jgi:hypothetical protein
MKKSRFLVLIPGAALVALLAMPSSSFATNSGSQTTQCAADVFITVSPTRLWPPNHTLQDISIVGQDTDIDADSVTIQVTGLASDQPIETGAGCSQPSNTQGPDMVGLGNSDTQTDPANTSISGVQLRAERCAQIGDRHYTITVSCSESNDGTGTATFTVTVPNTNH